MILYKTVKDYAIAEQIIEKSRFIAHVMPVSTKEEADAFIKDIKSQHKQATHNVPAMVIGDKFQIQWASDDGEPQGTSGAPIVQMLVNEGITNVACVVTRYFGGIKLGTGGLVRAYTSSVKLGLAEAGVCDVKEVFSIFAKMDYTYLAKFQNMAADSFFDIGDIKYEDMVTIEFRVDDGYQDQIKELITNITSGKGQIVEEVSRICKV